MGTIAAIGSDKGLRKDIFGKRKGNSAQRQREINDNQLPKSESEIPP